MASCDGDSSTTATPAVPSLPPLSITRGVFSDPLLRALPHRTRWVFLACLGHAWRPADDDDGDRWGCLRRPGVGPYSIADLAHLVGIDEHDVEVEVRRLKVIGVLDEVAIEGETYLRVVDFPRWFDADWLEVGLPAGTDRDDEPGVAEDGLAQGTEPSGEQADAEELPIDDPRVQWLLKNGIPSRIAVAYAGAYTLRDLIGHLYRVAGSSGVRNFHAVVISNLRHGRIEHLPEPKRWRGRSDGNQDA